MMNRDKFQNVATDGWKSSMAFEAMHPEGGAGIQPNGQWLGRPRIVETISRATFSPALQA